MKQVNKMLENVNKDMNAAELAKVMEKFEQVRISFFVAVRIKTLIYYFNLGI